MAYKEITPEQWEHNYKPIINTVNEGHNYVDEDGNKLYGWFDVWDEKDAEYLRSLDHNYVWTMVTEDNHDYLLSGTWRINRMEYYVCALPWTGEAGDIVADYGAVKRLTSTLETMSGCGQKKGQKNIWLAAQTLEI